MTSNYLLSSNNFIESCLGIEYGLVTMELIYYCALRVIIYLALKVFLELHNCSIGLF